MLEKYSMRITTRAGEVKTRTFREPVSYEDFVVSLTDFVFNHIGNSFIFDDFSRTTLEFRFVHDTYLYTFETIDTLKAWYLNTLNQ